MSEMWRSLKVRAAQYDALADCSEKTGRPIIKLADEALTWYIKQVVPVYNMHAERARDAIARRVERAPMRVRKAASKEPKSTPAGKIDTVSMAS